METSGSGPGERAPMVFYCQICRAKLIITGTVESSDKSNAVASAFYDAPGRIDESFIVLDSRRGAATAAAVPGVSNRALEESFVVLGSASMLRPGMQAATGAAQVQQAAQSNQAAVSPTATQGSSAEAAPGLDAKLQAMQQVFEMASTTTHVDHPMCLDCAAQLKDEVEAQIQETEREIACYAAAVARLEGQQGSAISEAEFDKEMARLNEAQEEKRTAAVSVEAELSRVNTELAALAASEADLEALEERYWHDYNAYGLALRQHAEDRDALCARIDLVTQRKQLLQGTNVFNDVFKIWHDGPFGTISGFRLGRTAEIPVEWDEINAAWGQAVLLLFTMAQACGLQFGAARLLPMGSHPRVSDKRATYDLFGPVSKLWSANYDKAMICYLACLREFGEFAAKEDARMSAAAPPFTFPFPIDGDKVNNHTIKLTLNKDAKWTKALKFMLADLKVALQWMVKHESTKHDSSQRHETARIPALKPEGLQR